MEQPKKLADIPVVPASVLDRIAELAPSDPQKNIGQGPLGPEKFRQSANKDDRKTPGSAPGYKLGPLDVGKYLAHYGIGYKTKPGDAGATLYTLFECVFDSFHGPNKASVVQAATGKLYYQCFHDSCANRTWRQAREKISGEDSLAQFCDGYDPNFKPKKKRFGPLHPAVVSDFDDLPEINMPMVLPTQVAVRPPSEVDSGIFHVVNQETNKYKLSYQRGAKYLSHLFHPICFTNSKFYRYSGGVWSIFPDGEINKAITIALGEEISDSRLANIKSVLQNRLFRQEEDWPKQDIELLNCKNGMLDLRTYELKPHHPDYGSRVQIPTEYDLDATADNFYRVLEEIFPGEESLVDGRPYQGKIRLVQEMFGYALWPTCCLETAFFLYGAGANGKGTICDALVAVIGEDNVSSLSMDDLAKQFRVQMLQGRLVNFCGENPDRAPLQTDVLKRSISGEMITVEQKFGMPFQFKPHCTFIFSMNMTPTITDKSYGFVRRVVLIKFNQSFKGTARDPSIKEKIGEEASGLLNFALAGLEAVRRRQNFYSTDLINQEKEEFMGRLNPVLQFAADSLEFVGDDKAYAFTEEVFKAYKYWCKQANHQPQSRTKFNEQLEQKFNIRKQRKTKTRRWAWIGARLKLEAIPPHDT